MLDKTSRVPLYFQIAKMLREEIASGKYPRGERLPSENQLSDTYGVSRVTIRQALKLLEENYSIYRVHGVGTFVSPFIMKGMSGFIGFSEKTGLLGMEVSSKVLAFQRVESLPEEMRRQLQILDRTSPSADLMQIKRTRLIDGAPAAIEDVYVPLEMFPGIEKYDFGNRSLYKTMNNVWGIVPVYSMQVMNAKAASEEEARYLDIPAGKPLLSVFRLTLSEGFTVIEYCESVYNTDKYIFLVRDSREI